MLMQSINAKVSLFFLCVFLTTTLFSQSKKKVLLIGIDGLQFEQIGKTKTPNFDKFTIKKGFNGGLLGTPSQQVTSSGPSWITILTGVWTDQHKITSNAISQISKAKSVFSFIKSSNPKLSTVSISTWKNINLLLYKDMYDVSFSTQGGGDDYSTNVAVSQIKQHAPDFIFIHLDDIDYAGHDEGFGNKYTKTVEQIDARIGKLLGAVHFREKNNQEEWLILLVTDHGRDLKGKGHGNQTLTEKTIFIGMNKKGNSFFENINNETPFKSIKELEKFTAPQTAIVPTILRFLNISILKEWKLDTDSLID